MTDLGKLLREIRIARRELLYDMAKKLGVSSSFLSAVENGKREIPLSWYRNLQKLYILTEDEKSKLDNIFGKYV